MQDPNFDDFDTKIQPEEFFDDGDDTYETDLYDNEPVGIQEQYDAGYDEYPRDWELPDEFNDGEGW